MLRLRFDPIDEELWLDGRKVWRAGEALPDPALLEWLARHAIPAELPEEPRARLLWWRHNGARPYQPFPSRPEQAGAVHGGWDQDLRHRRRVWARWPRATLPAEMPIRQAHFWGSWLLLDAARLLLYRDGELLYGFPGRPDSLPATCPPELSAPLRAEPFTPGAFSGSPAELLRRLAAWSHDPGFALEEEDLLEEVAGALVVTRGKRRWLLREGRTLEVGAVVEELRPFLGPDGPLSDLWAAERLGVKPPVQRVLALSERYRVVVGPRSGHWQAGGRWRRLWSAGDLEKEAVLAFVRAHPREVEALLLLVQWIPPTAKNGLTELLARTVGCTTRVPTMRRPVAWVGDSLVYLAYGEGLVALTPQGVPRLGFPREGDTPRQALERLGFPSLEAALAAARLAAL